MTFEIADAVCSFFRKALSTLGCCWNLCLCFLLAGFSRWNLLGALKDVRIRLLWILRGVLYLARYDNKLVGVLRIIGCTAVYHGSECLWIERLNVCFQGLEHIGCVRGLGGPVQGAIEFIELFV